MKLKIKFEIVLIFFLSLSLALPFFFKSNWNQTVFIIVSLVGITPVLVNVLRSLAKKRITIDLLASVALVFSFITGEWYSSIFINLMLSFARLFDVWTEERTNKIISQMLKYLPEVVKISKNKQVVTVGLKELKVGDLVIIETGDRIPVDGLVVSGQASINESTLTGESELVFKKKGDQVYSSTLNETGSLIVKAQKVGKDSRLEKMVALVAEVGRRKAKTELSADRFSTYYVAAMLLFAVFGYFFFPNRQAILAVLLVVCADDIAVAVPLTFTVAIAKAARIGVLIKGSEVIEKIAKLKIIITDKTGTLTLGKPTVVDLVFWKKGSRSKYQSFLAMATGSSHHPVSQAIANYLKDKGIKISTPEVYQEKAGEGVEISNNGTSFWLGKSDYLLNLGYKPTSVQQEVINKSIAQGFGLSLFADKSGLLGFITISDELRKNASKAITQTRKLGIEKWVMLTGDNQNVASRVSQELGIDQFVANLSPEQKVAWVEKLKGNQKYTLAMIGDGVNDAAALALADVSIAMGAIGSDAAIEAADLALVKDNLERIPQAIKLGQDALKIVHQEFIIWGCTNLLGLILVFTGILNPSSAAAYNFVTDFFPILNAMRLGLIKLDN